MILLGSCSDYWLISLEPSQLKPSNNSWFRHKNAQDAKNIVVYEEETNSLNGEVCLGNVFNNKERLEANRHISRRRFEGWYFWGFKYETAKNLLVSKNKIWNRTKLIFMKRFSKAEVHNPLVKRKGQEYSFSLKIYISKKGH